MRIVIAMSCQEALLPGKMGVYEERECNWDMQKSMTVSKKLRFRICCIFVVQKKWPFSFKKIKVFWRNEENDVEEEKQKS